MLAEVKPTDHYVKRSLTSVRTVEPTDCYLRRSLTQESTLGLRRERKCVTSLLLPNLFKMPFSENLDFGRQLERTCF